MPWRKTVEAKHTNAAALPTPPVLITITSYVSIAPYVTSLVNPTALRKQKRDEMDLPIRPAGHRSDANRLPNAF